MWWIIVAIVWVLGAIVAYSKYIKNWDNSQFEKIAFSLIWPLMLILYAIHYLHNKLGKKDE